MTKRELIQALEPFDDDAVVITMRAQYGGYSEHETFSGASTAFAFDTGPWYEISSKPLDGYALAVILE